MNHDLTLYTHVHHVTLFLLFSFSCTFSTSLHLEINISMFDEFVGRILTQNLNRWWFRVLLLFLNRVSNGWKTCLVLCHLTKVPTCSSPQRSVLCSLFCLLGHCWLLIWVVGPLLDFLFTCSECLYHSPEVRINGFELWLHICSTRCSRTTPVIEPWCSCGVLGNTLSAVCCRWLFEAEASSVSWSCH